MSISPGTTERANEHNDLDMSTALICLLPQIQGENSWCVISEYKRVLSSLLRCIEFASNHGPHESRIDLTSLGCFVQVNVFVHSSKNSTGNEQETLWIFPLAGTGGK